MSIRISDLLPRKISVDTGNGAMEVKPLNLQEITTLIQNFRGPILSLVESSSSGNPDFAGLMTNAPEMVVALIAMGADAVGQEDDIKQLPFAVQITAAAAIWESSVPDAKKLLSVLSTVMAQLRPAAAIPALTEEKTVSTS